MTRKLCCRWKDLLFLTIFSFSLFLSVGCSDSIDRSFISSIPESQIPGDLPVDSTSNGVLKISGGKIGQSTVDIYLKFGVKSYKESDVFIRLGQTDSTYIFQESLNKEPNNFLNDITYKYTFKGLVPNTKYFVWIVWKYGVESLTLKTEFLTLSE